MKKPLAKGVFLWYNQTVVTIKHASLFADGVRKGRLPDRIVRRKNRSFDAGRVRGSAEETAEDFNQTEGKT